MPGASKLPHVVYTQQFWVQPQGGTIVAVYIRTLLLPHDETPHLLADTPPFLPTSLVLGKYQPTFYLLDLPILNIS